MKLELVMLNSGNIKITINNKKIKLSNVKKKMNNENMNNFNITNKIHDGIPKFLNR